MKPPPPRPRRCENPRARMVATVCRATGDGAMINGALEPTPCPTTATCAVHTNGRGADRGEVCWRYRSSVLLTVPTQSEDSTSTRSLLRGRVFFLSRGGPPSTCDSRHEIDDCRMF